MTTEDPITHACRLLREAAQELACGVSINGAPDWANEPDAKAAHDEHMAAAAALEKMTCFEAGDMASAAAQGFRDGQASQARAVEPGRAEFALEALVAAGHVAQAKVDEALALAPQPATQALASQAQPVGAAHHWVPVGARLPEPGKPVLLDIGKKHPIRAMWAAKHTVEAHDEADADWSEYDEATDTYYCPEGWYEWNQNEEKHWAVSETPVAWCALPPPSSAKGVAL